MAKAGFVVSQTQASIVLSIAAAVYLLAEAARPFGSRTAGFHAADGCLLLW